jgi:transposase
MLTMYKQITIQTLHKQGVKQADIAKQLGCHRNTVRNVLRRQSLMEKQTRQKPSQFDHYKERIKEWLDQKITNLRIHELLTERHGVIQTYTTLCKYIQKQFPKQHEAFGVQVTKPGEEAELDFGYLGLLPGKDGKLTKTWGLAIVLSYSRVGYYALCYDQTLATLCAEIVRALAYFGGVPKRLKVDNMKTAVLKNTRGELEFNQEFLEFARHYTMVVVPCTPYSPEQKGKVESGIKYLQGNFVNGRTFIDAADGACKLKAWMQEYANQRVHGTTRKVPWQVLVETERQALQHSLLRNSPFLNELSVSCSEILISISKTSITPCPVSLSANR